MTKEVLLCSKCGKKLGNEGCYNHQGGAFKEGDEIKCEKDGFHHYCKGCILYQPLNAYAFSEKSLSDGIEEGIKALQVPENHQLKPAKNGN